MYQYRLSIISRGVFIYSFSVFLTYLKDIMIPFIYMYIYLHYNYHLFILFFILIFSVFNVKEVLHINTQAGYPFEIVSSGAIRV